MLTYEIRDFTASRTADELRVLGTAGQIAVVVCDGGNNVSTVFFDTSEEAEAWISTQPTESPTTILNQ